MWLAVYTHRGRARSKQELECRLSSVTDHSGERQSARAASTSRRWRAHDRHPRAQVGHGQAREDDGAARAAPARAPAALIFFFGRAQHGAAPFAGRAARPRRTAAAVIEFYGTGE
eukprot:7177476-Prymnesium_polylepis.2